MGLAPPFTRETAREMQKRSTARRLQLAQARNELLHSALARANFLESVLPKDPNVSKRRSLLRSTIEVLDKRIIRESLKPTPDGRIIASLAVAQRRLLEQERDLDAPSRSPSGSESSGGGRRRSTNSKPVEPSGLDATPAATATPDQKPG